MATWEFDQLAQTIEKRLRTVIDDPELAHHAAEAAAAVFAYIDADSDTLATTAFGDIDERATSTAASTTGRSSTCGASARRANRGL